MVFFVPPCRLYFKIIKGMKCVNDAKLLIVLSMGPLFCKWADRAWNILDLYAVSPGVSCSSTSR